MQRSSSALQNRSTSFFSLFNEACCFVISKARERLATNGMIWIAWPKKSSGVATDLSFARARSVSMPDWLT